MKIDSNIVAFITGASNGFGFQVGLDLLKKGVKCYLSDKQAGGEKLVEQFGNSQCVFITLDITDEDKVKQAIDDCVAKFGHLSVVINSAGIGTPSQSILDPSSTPEALKFVLKVNVVGSFNVTKFGALQFAKQFKNGNKSDYLIINFGSVASTHGGYGMINYSASKGAVLGMTLPIARDVGKFGIRVICMTPGFFNTPMGLSIPPRLYAASARVTCLGRHGEPSELSDAIQGIMECSFMTGTFFHLDSSIASPHL